MHGIHRSQLKAGLRVFIVLKQDQRSGKLTQGVVQDILTKSRTHPHGIKVRLENGAVGRVKKINGECPVDSVGKESKERSGGTDHRQAADSH